MKHLWVGFLHLKDLLNEGQILNFYKHFIYKNLAMNFKISRFTIFAEWISNLDADLKPSQTKFHQIRITKSEVIHVQTPVPKWEKSKKWVKTFLGYKTGQERLQIGAALGISNRGKKIKNQFSNWDFKSGERLQIGAREISNRGRDYKSVQNSTTFLVAPRDFKTLQYQVENTFKIQLKLINKKLYGVSSLLPCCYYSIILSFTERLLQKEWIHSLVNLCDHLKKRIGLRFMNDES